MVHTEQCRTTKNSWLADYCKEEEQAVQAPPAMPWMGSSVDPPSLGQSEPLHTPTLQPPSLDTQHTSYMSSYTSCLLQLCCTVLSLPGVFIWSCLLVMCLTCVLMCFTKLKTLVENNTLKQQTNRRYWGRVPKPQY